MIVPMTGGVILVLSGLLIINGPISLAWLWFLLCYAVIVYVAHALCNTGAQSDYLAPMPVFLALLFLYSFSSGLYVDQNGATYSADVISVATQRLFYLSCLAGALGFVTGSALAVRRPLWSCRADHGSPMIVCNSTFIATSLAIAALFAALSAGAVVERFDIFGASAYSDWALESRVERFADKAAGAREFLFGYIPTVLLLGSCIVLLGESRRWLVRGFALVILVAYLVTNTLSGRRGVVIEAAAPIVLYWHYRVRRIRLRTLLILGVSGYIFVNLMAIARASSNPMDMVLLVSDAMRESGIGLFGIASTSELWTAMNLHRLIEGLSAGETSLMYGSAMAHEIMALLPRLLVPDRPLTLSEDFTATFYPGLLEQGGGMGFFVLQEGYWALGLPGAFFLMIVFGYAVERMYRLFLARQISVPATLIYGFAFAPIVLSSVRSGVMSAVKAAILTIAPLVLAWVLAWVVDHTHSTSGKGSEKRS